MTFHILCRYEEPGSKGRTTLSPPLLHWSQRRDVSLQGPSQRFQNRCWDRPENFSPQNISLWDISGTDIAEEKCWPQLTERRDAVGWSSCPAFRNNTHRRMQVQLRNKRHLALCARSDLKQDTKSSSYVTVSPKSKLFEKSLIFFVLICSQPCTMQV